MQKLHPSSNHTLLFSSIQKMIALLGEIIIKGINYTSKRFYNSAKVKGLNYK